MRVNFLDAKIAFVLKQAEDDKPIGEICRKAGIAESTLYRWRKHFVGLMRLEIERLRQLDEENARLKRFVADLSLNKALLQAVFRRFGDGYCVL